MFSSACRHACPLNCLCTFLPSYPSNTQILTPSKHTIRLMPTCWLCNTTRHTHTHLCQLAYQQACSPRVTALPLACQNHCLQLYLSACLRVGHHRERVPAARYPTHLLHDRRFFRRYVHRHVHLNHCPSVFMRRMLCQIECATFVSECPPTHVPASRSSMTVYKPSSNTIFLTL